METVESLRAAGWRVGVRHTRVVAYPELTIVQYLPQRTIREEGISDLVSCHGGKTEVTVTPPGEEAGFKGEAKCSFLDNYDKRIGRTIALGRALKAYRAAQGGAHG